MTTRLNEDGPRVLSSDAFAFELDAELRRAVRARSYLTLVVVETGRDAGASGAAVDEAVKREIAETIGHAVRDTDLMGYLEREALGLVLLDADLERSTQVIDRVMSRLDTAKLHGAVSIAVGAACYPVHGGDAGSLEREAMSRVVYRRGGAAAGDHR